MKVVCIIQARTKSTRLPKKILKKVLCKEVLLLMIERVKRSKKIDQIVIATSDTKEDDVVEKLITKNCPEASVFRGPENDVLDRYYHAAKKYKADIVVRLTGDCPLIDWNIIDLVISEFEKGDYDYISNVLTRTFPIGFDVEVFSFNLLEKIWKESKDTFDREHVTSFIRKNPELFKTKNMVYAKDKSRIRLTLDEKEDLDLIKKIFEELYPNKENFILEEILDFLKKNPNLLKINERVRHNYLDQNESN
jgi:spore coat polysaccharide biosynthesis protein SpsF